MLRDENIVEVLQGVTHLLLENLLVNVLQSSIKKELHSFKAVQKVFRKNVNFALGS